MAEVHVFYEVDRLSLWSSCGLGPSDLNVPHRESVAALVGQATLESALLHLRVVSDFLLNGRPTSKKFESDLVADDYFDDGWSGRPDVLLGETARGQEVIRGEINRRLAHLSVQRLTEQTEAGGFVWRDVIGHAPAVLSAFREFVGDLEDAHPDRSRWFANSVAILDARTPTAGTRET